MPRLEQTSPADALDVEALYVAHRRAVFAMLRLDFPRLADPEEIYQEAWTELLEYQERSVEPVHNVRALLKRIAWRRATDEFRGPHVEAVDPDGATLGALSDHRSTPQDQVERRLASATVRMAIDELDPREATVIKLRFDHGLTSKEIQTELGLTANRLEKIVTEAYAKLADVISSEPGALSPLQRRQRSLLLACEFGIANSRQRRRAERMVEMDPWCRATVREMRQTLHDVASVLPMPALVAADERHGRRLEALVGWFHDLVASARGAARGAVERLPGGTSDGAAAGGSLIGGGAAAKVVAGCLAVGGGAAVCAVTLRSSPPPVKPPVAERTVRASVSPVPDRVAPKPDPPKPKPKPKAATKAPTSKQAKTRSAPKTEAPVSSPASSPVASPAPAGAVEFGPGSVGSAPAPTAPAAAPTNGGGEFTP